jgi:hypothetical protein
MLEKLATHDIEDVSQLFGLPDKCARVALMRLPLAPPAIWEPLFDSLNK